MRDSRCALLGSLGSGPRIPRTGSSEPLIGLTRFMVLWPQLRLASVEAVVFRAGSRGRRWVSFTALASSVEQPT